MRTTSSLAFEAFLRNPSILAMIGSAGVHAVLVLFSGLRPAESLPPPPLRVISLNPGSSPTNLNRLLPPNALPVPGGLPGDIPVGMNAMDIAKSSSPFVNLPSRDTPQQSPDGAGPVFKKTIPKNPGKGSQKTGQSKPGDQNPKGKSQSKAEDYSPYNTDPNASQPKVKPGDLANVPSAASSSSPAPGTLGSSALPTGPVDTGIKDAFGVFLQERSAVYKENISSQSVSIASDYSPETCQNKSQESAKIGAIFRADGSFTQNEKDITLMSSAPSGVLNDVAKAAVKNYRMPNPPGKYQAYVFTVDIPYSAALCQPKTSSPAPSSASPSPQSIPKSSSKSTKVPSPVSTKEDILKRFATPSVSVSPSISVTPSPSSSPNPSSGTTP
jgi:hypothetical protein